MVAIPAKAGNIICGEAHVKKPHMQFTCATSSLSATTGKFTCFYLASTSCRIHATVRNKTRSLRVTLPAGCKPTYLQFAGEFTSGVIADCRSCGHFCLLLRVFLCVIASILACVCKYFCLHSQVCLPTKAGNLA